MFASLASLAPLALLFASSARAHLQLKVPGAMGGLYSGKTSVIDAAYSYTSPLLTAGTSYPCKGPQFLNSDNMDVQTTWAAGTTQTFEIEGQAIHGGGSCQLSLSYDNGATWNVIYSYIGGCMNEGLTQSFELPAEAPSGTALFAWGWFNRIGNREMYHNCAVVEITGGGAGLSSTTDFPTPFVANAGVNDCSTEAGVDVVFPNPGKHVKYSGSYAGTTPAAGLGIVGTNCVYGATSSGSGNAGSGSGTSVGDTSPVISPTPSNTTGTSTGTGTGTGTGAGASAGAGTGTGAGTGNLAAVMPTPTPTGKVCKRWKSGRTPGSRKKRRAAAPAATPVSDNAPRLEPVVRRSRDGKAAAAHKAARRARGHGNSRRSSF